MNTRPSFAAAPADPSSDPADGCAWCADVKAARAERRQGRLEELAELGMDLARAMPRQVSDEAAPAADLAGLALAFTRIARAVRLTEALGERLDNPDRMAGNRKAGAGAGAGAEAGASADREEMKGAIVRVRGKLARMFVRARVRQVIEAEARERGDGYDAESLMADLDERLGGPENLAEFASVPTAELVARICRDLGVAFDGRLLEEGDEADAPHGPSPPDMEPRPPRSGFAPPPSAARDPS